MTACDALSDSRGGVRLFDRRLSRRRIHQPRVLGWHRLLPDDGDCIRIRLGSVANQDIGAHGETLTMYLSANQEGWIVEFGAVA